MIPTGATMMTIAADQIIQVGLVEDQAETLSRMIAAVRSSADMRVLFHAASVAEATRA